jgi:hypothetical protein
MNTVDTDLRKLREETIYRHIGSESTGDYEGWRATFRAGRVSYDLPALAEVLEEEQAREIVSRYFDSVTDYRREILHVHHADDAVILELRLNYVIMKTADGAPADRPVSTRLCVIFRFDGDQMWQEVAYGGADWHI